VLGVHCGIYKSSNIYIFIYIYIYIILEFTLSIILLYPLLPPFLDSFSRSHFSIYIHVYTVFALYSPSYTLFQHPPPSSWYPPPHQGPVYPCVLWLCKRKQFGIFVCLINKNQGVSLLNKKKKLVFKKHCKLGVVVHACNLNTVAEARGS
jgi:hypothetical protein